MAADITIENKGPQQIAVKVSKIGDTWLLDEGQTKEFSITDDVKTLSLEVTEVKAVRG